MKRAQILIADLWSGFEGESFGALNNIDSITMFADYRIPQILNYFDVLQYDECLNKMLEVEEFIHSGSPIECEIRGCSILAVEKIRKAIAQRLINMKISTIQIDYYLWVLAFSCSPYL